MRTHTAVTHSQANPRADTPKPTRKRSPRATTSSAPNTSTQQPPKPQKPLLLDLFCGAGGAGMGYSRAGFDVVGVDLVAQPHYPFVFRQGDALACLDALLAGREWGGYVLEDFAAIHASPPCQHYAPVTRWRGKSGDHPDLIAPTRQRLLASGVPWVIENVPYAPLQASIMLCGSMFGLAVRRHREFETSWGLFQLMPACKHRLLLPFEHKGERAYADAMGCTWMTKTDAREAIPPAYTEWLGRQLMAVIAQGRAA